jgi:hypothetical protein
MSSRTSILTFTAIAALGTSCLVPTDASALGFPAHGAAFSRHMVQAPPRPVNQQVRTQASALANHAPAAFSSSSAMGHFKTSSVDHTVTSKNSAGSNVGNHIMSGGNGPVDDKKTAGGNTSGGNTSGGKTATGGNMQAGGIGPKGGNASGGPAPNGKTGSGGKGPVGGNTSMGGNGSGGTPPNGKTGSGGKAPASPADILANNLRDQANAKDKVADKANADATKLDNAATATQQTADALAKIANAKGPAATAADKLNAQNAQLAADQTARAAKKADADAKRATMDAQKADSTATQAEQAAKQADKGSTVPPSPPVPGVTPGGGGTPGGKGGGGIGGGGGFNVSVGGGTPDGGTQVVGLGGGGAVLVPQPAPGFTSGPSAYGTTGSAYGGASGGPATRLTTIALGWNLDGAWVVRKNPSVDAATRDAVNQCNSQFGTCSLSDVVVTPAAFGCLAIARGSDNANRLFAAARGSIDAARAAVMDQMTSAGSSGDVLYADCNG